VAKITRVSKNAKYFVSVLLNWLAYRNFRHNVNEPLITNGKNKPQLLSLGSLVVMFAGKVKKGRLRPS
jgi:hypothetical protein